MRLKVAFLGFVIATAMLPAEAPADTAPARRYGVFADLEVFPQDTPQNALASVLKAIERKRIDYLLAQLADPEWVEKRIKDEGGKFDDLVQETKAKLAADATAIKELGRFLREGNWDVKETTASSQLKDVPNRRVYLRKIGDRWFLENRQQPNPEER